MNVFGDNIIVTCYKVVHGGDDEKKRKNVYQNIKCYLQIQ